MIQHFSIDIPLPELHTITPYQVSHTGKASKKVNKHKFDRFTYYYLNDDKVMKVLYKDEVSYLLQGYYPFTDPEVLSC